MRFCIPSYFKDVFAEKVRNTLFRSTDVREVVATSTATTSSHRADVRARKESPRNERCLRQPYPYASPEDVDLMTRTKYSSRRKKEKQTYNDGEIAGSQSSTSVKVVPIDSRTCIDPIPSSYLSSGHASAGDPYLLGNVERGPMESPGLSHSNLGRCGPMTTPLTTESVPSPQHVPLTKCEVLTTPLVMPEDSVWSPAVTTLSCGAITTPIVLESVRSLQQAGAPEEVFPDLLDIIDDDENHTEEEAPDAKAPSANERMPNGPVAATTEADIESSLFDILVSVSERVKCMTRRPRSSTDASVTSLNYKDLKCTVHSQKGKHSKKMKMEDERHLKQLKYHERKEKFEGRGCTKPTRKSGRHATRENCK